MEYKSENWNLLWLGCQDELDPKISKIEPKKFDPEDN